MSYCTFTDVQADFKNTTFASGYFITDAAVTQFIVEADALINSYVGNRYVIPIAADATSLALMKLFSRTLVSDRVRGILENKQASNTDGNANVRTAAYKTSDVMKALNDIKNNDMSLSGATLVVPSAGFFSNNNQSNVTPQFHKNSRQW